MEGISAHYQLLLITGFLCFKIWKRFDISDDSIMLLMFDICWLYLDIRWHWVPSSQAHTSSNRRRRRRVWRTSDSEIHSCQGDSWDRLQSSGRTVAGRSVLAGCSHTVNTAAQWRGQGDSSRQHTGHTTDLQSLCNSSQISVKWRHIKHSQSSKPVGCNSNCTLTDLVLPRPALSLAVGRWPSQPVWLLTGFLDHHSPSVTVSQKTQLMTPLFDDECLIISWATVQGTGLETDRQSPMDG